MVCTLSAWAISMCASENHISSAPGCFLHLPRQAEVHTYSGRCMSHHRRIFLLSFDKLGILAANFLDVYIFGYRCRWAVVS
jgi:hypothetical protein